MQKFNPVVWFEIYVQDMSRAQKFYEEMLQVKMQDMSDPTNESMKMVGFPSPNTETEMAPGCSGSLVQMKGVPSGGSTIVYFGCEDCAVEEARVAAAGGQVHKTKMSIGEFGFMSLVVDTEGNMIGLHSMQ